MSRPYPLDPSGSKDFSKRTSQAPAGTTESVAGPSGSCALRTTTVEDYIEEQDDITAMPSSSKASVSGSTTTGNIGGTTTMALNNHILQLKAHDMRYIHSTPPKIRTESSNHHHHASVDPNLVDDITRYTHRGIPVEDFLKLAFDLDEAAYEELESKIDGWDIVSDGAYKEELAAFVNPKREEDMYQPLADIGNMFLKRGEKEGNVMRELRLRVVDKTSMLGTLSKSRKPDVVLEALRNIPDTHQLGQATKTVEHESEAQAIAVPSGEDETEEEKKGQTAEISEVATKTQRAHVLSVLVPFEFKAARSSNAAKVSEILNHKLRRAAGKRKMREEGEESAYAEDIDEEGFEVIPSQPPTSIFDLEPLSEEPGTGFTRTAKSTGGDRPFHKRYKSSGSGRGAPAYTSMPTTFPSTSSTFSGSISSQAKAKHEASGRLQLAGYATELLCARGDRSHVFGIRVVGKDITLCFYHRAGIVEATPFKLDDPESNPSSSKSPIYLAIFLTRFQGDPASYGFMADTGYANPFDSEDASTRGLGVFLKQIEDSTNKRLDQALPIDQIEVKDVHERRYDLIGRGTTVVDVEMPGFEEPELVAKSSWQIADRTHEQHFILAAREVIGKHAPELYAHGEVRDNSRLEALIAKCKKKARYEPRELRILIMKKYRPLHELEGFEFWMAIVQLAICLHLLYMRKGLLHQDISMGNLAYYRDETTKEVVVVLLDFDLASMPDSTRHVSKHRTGTAPFMAREVLKNDGPYTHKIYHDLESLFYTLVWHAVGYRGKELPPGKDWDPLEDWRKGKASDMLNAKNNFISSRKVFEAAFGVGQNDIIGQVSAVWDAYHTAMRDGTVELTPEEKTKRARAVAAEVVAKGGSQKDGKIAYFDEYARLSSDSTVIEGLGITYKTWMRAAQEEFGGEHSGCNCC